MPLPRIVRGQSVSDEKLRRAKELRREMTSTEAILWERLRRGQLNGLHFRRQQVIDGFIADFYCNAAAVVVEVDGPIHETMFEQDAERSRLFAERGLLVLRFANQEVESELERVLARKASVCLERKGKV